MSRRAERGQALTEYVLVVLALVLALFTPTALLADSATGASLSVFGALIRAFDVYLDSFHTVITLPIP